MEKFSYIPKEYWPCESDHVTYLAVYRATKNVDKLTPNDFLPAIIEYANQKRTFKSLFNGSFSCSLFTNLEIAKKKTRNIIDIKSYSKGYTCIKRGISTVEKNSHVDYYLYDYNDNSPCADFNIEEVKEI